MNENTIAFLRDLTTLMDRHNVTIQVVDDSTIEFDVNDQTIKMGGWFASEEVHARARR